MADSGIYRLVPFAVPKPWGGGHLDRLAGNAGHEKIGEYIIFSDLWQFPVRVELGNETPLVKDFCAAQGIPDVPFMLKVLSTSEPISLQNHPSDQDVRELGLEGSGKFECWSILEADEYARAYLGLRAGENKSILEHLTTDTHPLSHFNEYKPRRGDIIKLEPGLVHSTTGRLLFYEIQQKSDHTFRLYDFGRNRALHIREAMHCVREQKPDISLFSAGLRTEKFSVSYHEILREGLLTPQGRAVSVLTWFGREAELSCGGSVFPLHWGDSFLARGHKKCRIECGGDSGGKRYAGLPMIDMMFEAYI